MEQRIPDCPESDRVIQYLNHLVGSYEELVKDMSDSLNKYRDELIVIGKHDISHASHRNQSCEACLQSRRIVENLKSQIENLIKAKRLTTSLWHSSVEQIENLENRLKNETTSGTHRSSSKSHPPEHQLKIFQTYTIQLEGRLEQASQEKNFYRRKLMEAKLEGGALLKGAAMERQKEIELVKSTYRHEIDHLKQVLEKERQMYRSSLEKKLEEERGSWLREEQERREHLKRKWMAELQPWIVEQDAALFRESQLCEKLHQTQLEVHQLREFIMLSQRVSLQSQPGTSAVENDSETPKKESRRSASKIDRMDTPVKHCDHDECVKYSMYQKVLHENERLGEDIKRLRQSGQALEDDYRQNARRLELRIHDLETLNTKLQAKLINETNGVVNSHISPCETNQAKISQPTSGDPRNHRKITTVSKENNHTYNNHGIPKDPVLTLADEFSQLCQLPFDDKFKDPVTRAEIETRVKHLEKYARELQCTNQYERHSRVYFQDRYTRNNNDDNDVDVVH